MNENSKKPWYEKISICLTIIAGICTILGLSVFGGRALFPNKENKPVSTENLSNKQSKNENKDEDKNESKKNQKNTTTVKVNGKDVEFDNETKIPTNSKYPNVSMELKDTSFKRETSKEMIGMYDDNSGFVSDPIVSAKNNKGNILKEIKKELLRNPVVRDMVARGLLYDTYWFKDNEPWLNEFVEKSNSYFEKDLNSNLNSPQGLTGYFKNEKKKCYVTLEYRMYAEKLCDLLDKFQNYGVKLLKFNSSWGVGDGSLYTATRS